MPRIASLGVADPPALWSALGFHVDSALCRVGSVEIRLDAPGRGITSWTLAADIDGLPTPDAAASSIHPNGVQSIDHLVVLTPAMDRTVAALEAAGLPLRRRRETERTVQSFFRMGEVILEVVAGPPGQGPARFFGLAFTCADLEATAGVIGPQLHPAKDAVQPGRRIATLDRTAGSTVPLAFMSPEPR